MGRTWYMTFDEKQMRRLLQNMTPRSRIYKIVKQELQARGWWKNRVRGRHARRNDERQTN